MADTRALTQRRIAAARTDNGGCSGGTIAFVTCVALPLIFLYSQQGNQQPARPLLIVENIHPLTDLHSSTAAPKAASSPSPQQPRASTGDVLQSTPSQTAVALAEHESAQPMAVLNRERAKAGGTQFAGSFKVYRPARIMERPGGDLDDPATLANTVPAAAADGEVMILCIGGSGS